MDCPIPLDVLHRIRLEQEAAPRGEKRAVIDRYAAQLGMNWNTLYQWLARVYGKTKEVEREASIPQELVDWIARRKLFGMEQGLVEREVSTEACLAMARREGVAGAESASVSGINTRLRAAGLRKKKPITRVQARFANQVWQADFSRSKYFQVATYDAAREDYLLRISGRHLHYKENGQLRNLWLTATKDHHSGVAISHGYISAGETALMGLQFFDWVFLRGADGLCLRGVPYDLKCDNGAFRKAAPVREAFRALQVNLPASTPYNKESQGLIERNWRDVWSAFELPLVVEKGAGWTCFLSEYNELLHQHMLAVARRPHTNFPSRTREEQYLLSLQSYPPREVDESILRYACHVETRVIDRSQRVRIDNTFYAVPHKVRKRILHPGEQIRVYRALDGAVVGELIEEFGISFELGDWEPSEYGDFSKHPRQTYRQAQTLVMHQEEKAREDERKAAQAGKIRFMPVQATKIEPAGPVVDAVEQAEPERLTLVEARAEVGRALAAFGLSIDDVDLGGVVVAHMTRADVQDLITRITTPLKQARAM